MFENEGLDQRAPVWLGASWSCSLPSDFEAPPPRLRGCAVLREDEGKGMPGMSPESDEERSAPLPGCRLSSSVLRAAVVTERGLAEP